MSGNESGNEGQTLISILAAAVGLEGGRNLLHQVSVLKDMKGFLLSFPVLGTDDNESLSGTTRHLERLVLADNLFNKAFQVVSEFVYSDDIHHFTIMNGNAVRL
jgi:hypothetical protein